MRPSLHNSKLIAIAGLANSGKSEGSRMLEYILNSPRIFRNYFWYELIGEWKGKWKTTAFAKPLKQTLSIILNKPIKWFDDRINKEHCYVDLNTLQCFYKLNTDIIKSRVTENRFAKLIKAEEPIAESVLTIRQLMQYYGTSVIRKYLGDKTWINATLNACDNDNLIISDLRFKVEYEEVKKRGGTTIYINRPGCKPGSHASEREVINMLDDDLFDIVIDNSGTLRDLFNQIKSYV